MVPDAFILLNSHRYEVGYTDATPETEMSKETPKRSTSIPGHVEQEYSHNRYLRWTLTHVLLGVLILLIFFIFSPIICLKECQAYRDVARHRDILREECSSLKQLLDEQVHVQTLDKARATLNYDTVSSKLKAAAADLNNIRKANEAMESNEPMIAIMTILKDETSLGFDRRLPDYFDMLDSIDYPKHRLSLNVLVSNEEFYYKMEAMMKDRAANYSRRSLYFRDIGIHIGRSDGERHAPSTQKKRRSMLSMYRNSLLSLSLRNESYVLWLDGDMEEVPANLLKGLLRPKKDIITPRCLRGHVDYDLNTWSGPRRRPFSKEEYREHLFIPMPTSMTKHMSQLAKLGEEFVTVDSVGGTVLLVKSNVHINGAMFPPYYVIGSDWDTEGGFDGIETEGLCYIASTVGYQCYGAPKIHVYHHDS